MYRCDLCGVVVQPNTPARKLVTETRRKVYSERHESNRIRIQGKKKPLHVSDPGGVGWEVVREVKVCRACYESWLEEHEGQPFEHQPAETLASVLEDVKEQVELATEPTEQAQA